MECNVALISGWERESMLEKYCTRTSGCGFPTESGSTDTLKAGPSRLDVGKERPLQASADSHSVQNYVNDCFNS